MSRRVAANRALPDMLIEYGRLAAQLPDTNPIQDTALRCRLQELDAILDRQLAERDQPGS